MLCSKQPLIVLYTGSYPRFLIGTFWRRKYRKNFFFVPVMFLIRIHYYVF
ncbi:hypothetical protein HMPREF1548_05105 [Clostridium sp. KLE 1755]|nr:hypothetical protein HMPREF1548_05105 [Clostridium sp. KLE 1755]